MSAVFPGGVCAVTCALPGSRHEIFRFLADIENLPRWAGDFCSELELSRGRWLAYSPTGEAFVELDADERTGTIDLKWSGDRGEVRMLPLRIMALPGGQTLLCAIFLPRPGIDEITLERDAASLAAALRDLEAVLQAVTSRRRLAG